MNKQIERYEKFYKNFIKAQYKYRKKKLEDPAYRAKYNSYYKEYMSKRKNRITSDYKLFRKEFRDILNNSLEIFS